LKGVDIVIHTAARLNVVSENGADSLAEFTRVNFESTVSLARQALTAGVKRFIFISTVGVNGSSTKAAPFDEASVPEPAGEYAYSKYEAEQGLRALLEGTQMELVLIRTPLVYAAHAPRNFGRLLELIASGVPLPFALLNNQRSIVALENLVEFISLCSSHPKASNELFLISDGVDISTARMVRTLAESMGSKTRLLPVPDFLIRLAALLTGKGSMYTTLCASLRVDSSKASKLLGWVPVLTPHQALQLAGRQYKER
jgi:nucleoside-diphosphate-sugar epimerase